MPTPWFVPPGDDDCDAFTATLEGYIGTDPLDPCADNPSDDAWPPDVDNDTEVNVLDLSTVGGSPFGQQLGDPDYWERVDFNADEQIDILDLSTISPFFGFGCTP